MNKVLSVLLLPLLSMGVAVGESIDFGSGGNAFTLDFTDMISGTSNPTVAQTNATQTEGALDGFGIVTYDYRMGKYEITQSQFDVFRTIVNAENATGGNPNPFPPNVYWATNGANRPANLMSWFEAAQFVNWLNTSSGYAAAYNMSSSENDVSGATFDAWTVLDSLDYDATNPYRSKRARYFLPSEDEWLKAAYWNGSNIQEYAIGTGVSPPGNYSGGGSNYYYGGYAVGSPDYFWDVGSSAQEINGTYDMMGNVSEWMESAFDATYGDAVHRTIRGGAVNRDVTYISASTRYGWGPSAEREKNGFRVAFKYPESQCLNPPAGDLDSDCIVGLLDLAILANTWLDCGLRSGCP